MTDTQIVLSFILFPPVIAIAIGMLIIGISFKADKIFDDED